MADINKRIILTTVYDRRVLVYLEDGEPIRIRVIGDEPAYPIGCVVLGRVKKMLDSSGACFMDIGDDTDYFLKLPAHLSDLKFADGQEHKRIHPEDMIMVQVTSEAVKLKSPCVSGNISLTSRHFVIESGRGLSFSSKIDQADRKSVVLPENISTYSSKYHIIVRTEASDNNDPDALLEELEALDESYEDILRRLTSARVHNVLYRPAGYLESLINDWLKYGCDEIVTDLEDYADVLSGSAAARDIPFRIYSDELPMCKLYKLETLIDQCISKKVYLKSGAFLVIEQGETLTAIDVNSGHDIKGNKEEKSFQININAAHEIVKQLRLRNISGMILVDFINMRDKSHLDELIKETVSVLKTDDVKSRFVDMTGLGLMEITRKRIYKSFSEQWKHLS